MAQMPEFRGIVHWNDQDEEASGQFQNTVFDSVNSKGNVVSGFQSSEAVSNRITLSTEFNQQEVELDSCKGAGPLGLALKKTPSFLNLVEMMLFQKRNIRDTDGYLDQKPLVSQPKPSNLPASSLKIGSWNRIARHEGDLIVKCYYAKRKLAWEILDRGLKSKIEMKWDDILAIRATIHANEPGILEIELNRLPLFFREINPQPRKHTHWQQATDFTGGEAPKCRRHCVEFPPNTLDEHYHKLLQCDKRLLMLSQEPFPSLKSPYFNLDNGFSLDSIGINSKFPLQRPLSSIPPPYMFPSHHVFTFKPTTKPPVGHMNLGSSMSGINTQYPFHSPYMVTSHHVSTFKPTTRPPIGIMDLGSPISVHSYGFENQLTSLWGQGLENVAQTDSDFSSQDYYGFNYGKEEVSPLIATVNTATLSDIEKHLSSDSVNTATLTDIEKHLVSDLDVVNTKTLAEIEKHLLSDSDVVISGERTLLAKVRSMASFLEPTEETNRNIDSRVDHFEYKQDNIMDEDQLVSSTIDHSRIDGGPKPIHGLFPRVSEEILMVDQWVNNSLYPNNFSNSTEEDFATVDGVQGELYPYSF